MVTSEHIFKAVGATAVSLQMQIACWTAVYILSNKLLNWYETYLCKQKVTLHDSQGGAIVVHNICSNNKSQNEID